MKTGDAQLEFCCLSFDHWPKTTSLKGIALTKFSLVVRHMGTVPILAQYSPFSDLKYRNYLKAREEYSFAASEGNELGPS